MKKVFIVTISFIVFSSICTMNIFAAGRRENIPEGKLIAVATFNAMEELAKVVGQDKVYVRSIIPAGMEAHDFEPKAGDLKLLSQAHIVIYNGLGMEPWLEHAVKAVNNTQLTSVCASEGIEPIQLEEGHHHHHHDGHHKDHDGEHHHHTEDCDCGEEHEHHGGHDPHAWLSLNSAKVMVMNISKAFSKADPAHAAFYKANAAAFITEADMLLTDYQKKFAAESHKHFVTGHAAFGYLCRDFGLAQNSVEDVFSAGEPTAKQLAALTEYCKEHNIKTIFAESMVSPEVSKTLAKEVGAEVQVIYTIESAEDHLSYMDRMKSNIEKIYKSVKK